MDSKEDRQGTGQEEAMGILLNGLKYRIRLGQILTQCLSDWKIDARSKPWKGLQFREDVVAVGR